MLAVIHDYIAYPLFFSMLPKKGNFNSAERIALIQRYINLFGTDTIDCLMTDREGRQRWIEWLNDNLIRYYIRVKENFWVKIPSTGKMAKVS